MPLLTHHYAIAQSLTAISSFLIAVFIFWRGRERGISKVYATYNAMISAWAFCWLLHYYSDSREVALLWGRLLHIPAVLIAPTFLHFTFYQTGVRLHKKSTGILVGAYVIAVMFGAATFSPYFIPDVGLRAGIPLFVLPGPIFTGFMIYFSLVYITGLAVLAHRLTFSDVVNRRQLIYLLAAYSMGFVGGSQAFLMVYDISMSPYGLYLITLTHLIIFYLILRHRFMEPKILIRRVGLGFAIYGVLLCLALPLLYVGHVRVQGASLAFSFFEIVLTGAVLSVGPFLYAYFLKRSSFFHEHTLASITHELKSPLVVIEGALDAIKAQSSLLPKDQLPSDYMEMIERNTERLKNTVNDLLQVYKVQDKKESLDVERFDLMELLNELTQEKKELAQQRGNQLALDLPKGVHDVMGDREKIKQVLSNLISNANKFTSEGTITLSLQVQPKQYEISIKDSGCGLSAEEIPYIFDRFYQGQKHKKGKGTGIGLAIAKLWVEAHGGTIHAESAGEGQGSRFWFTIPKRP